MPELIFAVKFVALALLIVQCGRSLVTVVLADARSLMKEGELHFVAISFGVGALLIIAILMRSVGVYRWSMMIGATVAVTAIATLWSRRAMRTVKEPGEQRRWWPTYVLTVAILLLWQTPETYPEQAATATYLLQGFDLYEAKDPAAWPYFGEVVRMPLLFVTHAIGVTFNLFSAGNPYRFYLDGLFWANVLLAPLVPIGTYIFLRRKFGWIVSLLFAAAFCYFVLDLRTWSVRGETLGWILGFAFLISVDALGGEFANPRVLWRVVLLLTPIYLVLALTHGVSALITSIMAATLVTYRFVLTGVDQGSGGGALAVLRAAVAAAAALAVLSLAYMHAFTEPHAASASRTDVPLLQEPDAAVLFEDALLNRDRSNAPLTRVAPPYLDPVIAAQLSAFVPVASLFRPTLRHVTIDAFPSNALARLEQVPWMERAAYALLLVLCCISFWRGRLTTPDPTMQMFIVSVATYVGIVAFCLVLNAQSRSIFPLAASRRIYSYVLCFYWLAVALTLLNYAERTGRRLLGVEPNRPSFAVSGWRAAVLVPALPLGLMLSMWRYDPGTLTLGGWMRRLPERRALFESIGTASSGTTAARWSPRSGPLRSFQNLFDAIEAIKMRTLEGEYVYVNMLSDNQFWYLSSGRISLLEGSAMYQVYGLQRPAADRIEHFRDFAKTGDAASLDGRSVRFVLLHKSDSCVAPACFGFAIAPANMAAFSSNPRFERTFENDDFVLWSVKTP